jgi:hypothetical protein
MKLNKKRKIAILITFNIILIVILGWFVFEGAINIKYMNVKDYPESVYVTEGDYPSLLKTENGSLVLIFSKINRLPEQQNASWEIFLIISDNGKEWNKIVQLTNDSYFNVRPKLIQQNESTFRVYYRSRMPDPDYDYDWKYIESKNLINWTNPIFCERPSINNQYWSEINNPPFFEQAKEYSEQHSLIKNHEGKYLLAGEHDVSSSDCMIGRLFITISEDGKDWDLPILIAEEDISWPPPSLIEIENGTYVLVYQYNEKHDQKINIITFSDSDLENVSGPHRVFYDTCIICFVFCLILLFIFDSIIIKSLYKKKYEWREFVPGKAIKNFLILIGIIFIMPFLFLFYLTFPSIMIIIISLIVLLLIPFILWKSRIQRIGLLHGSYSIYLEIDKINISKIISSIKHYLKNNKIGYKYKSMNFKDGTFHYYFLRQDNLQSFIEIWKNLDREVIIYVFSSEFDNIDHVIPIMKLIRYEKS